MERIVELKLNLRQMRLAAQALMGLGVEMPNPKTFRGMSGGVAAFGRVREDVLHLMHQGRAIHRQADDAELRAKGFHWMTMPTDVACSVLVSANADCVPSDPLYTVAKMKMESGWGVMAIGTGFRIGQADGLPYDPEAPNAARPDPVLYDHEEEARDFVRNSLLRGRYSASAEGHDWSNHWWTEDD